MAVGDTFIVGDYEYTVRSSDGILNPSVSAQVVDKTKTVYGDIPNTVYYNSQTYQVSDLTSCFEDCTNLSSIPKINISNTLTLENLTDCFKGCTSLTDASTLNISLYCTTIQGCFQGCTSLRIPPIFTADINAVGYEEYITSLTDYSSLTNVSYCFEGCTSLETAPKFPSTVTNMSYCFMNCTSLTDLSDYKFPEAVTNISYCFTGCTSLESVSENKPLPSTVTNMAGCFSLCSSLSSTPIIPSSVTNVDNCFNGCTNIAGNLYVANAPSSSTSIFSNTTGSTITIVPTEGDYVRSTWTTVASYFSNVSVDNTKAMTEDMNYQVTSIASREASCAVIDTDKTYYTTIPSGVDIDGYPHDVVSLDNCFANCANLIISPRISDGILSMYNTFYGCTSLTAILNIPESVTNLTNCFGETNFKDLSSLYIPDSVTSMDYCFENCANLEIPPMLPDNLETMDSCFSGCTLLKYAPELPVSLTSLAYAFQDCEHLSGTIHSYFDPDNAYLERIFDGTYEDIFVIPHSASDIEAWKYYMEHEGYPNVYVLKEPAWDTNHHTTYDKDILTFGGYDVAEDKNKIISYYDISLEEGMYISENGRLEQAIENLKWFNVYDKPNEKYLYIEAIESATISLDRFMTEGATLSSFTNYVEPSFQYSYDSKTWSNYTLNSEITLGTSKNNVRVYLRGDNLDSWYGYYTENSTTYYTYIMFNINSGRCKAGGNVMSMRYLNPIGNEEIPCTHAFHCLFRNCTSLITPPNLPATTLTDYCYYNMFSGCTSLKYAPELPATTLADQCYAYMFNGCTSLMRKKLTKLPATTLTSNCYNGMFNGCTSLDYPPNLPATTLAESCYAYMFWGCTSLTVLPALPATTLTNYCYQYMFAGSNYTGVKAATTDTSPCLFSCRIPTGTATGTVGTNSLTNMFINSAGTGYFTPTINTTFYTDTVAMTT